jgi:hypothetical protein
MENKAQTIEIPSGLTGTNLLTGKKAEGKLITLGPVSCALIKLK